jgi:formiminoglutamase
MLQTIPHAGLAVPPEVAGRLAIDDVTIYNDCDLWADALYDFDHPDLAALRGGEGPATLGVVGFDVARVLIDANRPPDSLDNPDGAVKSATSYGDPIYSSPLTPAEQTALRDRYWGAFHQAVAEKLRQRGGEIRLFLDCHNMAQTGPSAYGDPGKLRPLICIANNGDAKGDYKPGRGDLIAPPALARRAREIAADLFADLPLLEPIPGKDAPVAALNSPFAAGYIARYYTNPAYQRSLGLSEENGYIGLMVEINRGLYVGNQDTRSPIQPPNQERIAAIRERLYRWVVAVMEEM